jgi:hypothetical protein
MIKRTVGNLILAAMILLALWVGLTFDRHRVDCRPDCMADTSVDER